jgi:DNA-binding MarR family transcriptional regulator
VSAATKSGKALKLQAYLPYRLSVASNQVSNLISNLYRGRYGLSIWQWRVIALLGASGKRTAQQIADQAAMDKMTVSRAVADLLKRDLVHRQPSSTDRRAQILRLSPEGQRIHDEIAPLAKEQETILLSGMSADEIEQLFFLLQRLEARSLEISQQDEG